MRSGHWRAWDAAAELLCGATLPLSALAILIAVLPGCDRLLEWNAGGVRASECWRALTCHWTHWSVSHLAWDVGMFALLGWLCERRSPRRFAMCLAGAAIIVPLVVGLAHPEMSYRGLSGLDSALFGLLAAELLQDRRRAGDHKSVALIAGVLLAFCGKISYEWLTSDAVFVDGADMVPVPLAHVVGAVIGVVVGAIRMEGCGLSGRLGIAAET